MNNHESGQLYDLVVMGVEKSLLEMVPTETGRNQTQAAKILGINPENTLRKNIQEYSL